MFWIRGEGNVYFNIREEGSVIQTSLRGEECNLLLIKSMMHMLSLCQSKRKVVLSDSRQNKHMGFFSRKYYLNLERNEHMLTYYCTWFFFGYILAFKNRVSNLLVLFYKIFRVSTIFYILWFTHSSSLMISFNFISWRATLLCWLVFTFQFPWCFVWFRKEV